MIMSNLGIGRLKQCWSHTVLGQHSAGLSPITAVIEGPYTFLGTYVEGLRDAACVSAHAFGVQMYMKNALM